MAKSTTPWDHTTRWSRRREHGAHHSGLLLVDLSLLSLIDILIEHVNVRQQVDHRSVPLVAPLLQRHNSQKRDGEARVLAITNSKSHNVLLEPGLGLGGDDLWPLHDDGAKVR